MARRRTWTAVLLCAAFVTGCGLRSSSVATRPPGHVRDAAAEPDAIVMTGIDLGADRAIVTPKADGPSAGSPDPWGGIDCQGTQEQVNDCIINAPTKSGIPATRSKPTLTYQTCGAQ